MEKIDSVLVKETPSGFAVFDGFPYLVTLATNVAYHFTLLPRGPAIFLLAIAESQHLVNDLPQCLVLNHRVWQYYWHEGTEQEWRKQPPLGGTILFGKLHCFRHFPLTQELLSRYEKLAGFKGNGGGNLIFGDFEKGGRTATAEQIRKLTGKQPNGIPVGLVRCPHCGHWKGECLDPSPEFAGKVMPVHCLCDNRNYCARCGQLLYQYKLNANYYDEAGCKVCHVPGFKAFEHRCSDDRREVRQ